MPISYSRLLVSPAVAKFLEEEFISKNQSWEEWLRDKFLFPSHGLYLKPIDDNIFSVRTNIKKRLLLVFVKDADGNDVPYIFDHYENHILERPQDKALYKEYNKRSPEIIEIETPTVVDLDATQIIIDEPETRRAGKSKRFRKLTPLDRDQCEITESLKYLYQQGQPYCVNSIAGSGKTCLALLQLANIAQDLAAQPQEKLIYLTKSPHLAARQQKEFAKVHPQLANHVEFLSHNEFLERNKKAGTLPIATYQNFLVWYQNQIGVHKDKKFNGKQYPQSETLYDEFNHLSGNYDSQDGYLNAPAGHCRFNKKLSEQDSSSENQQELNREEILELYKNYQEDLFTQGVVDPIRVKLEPDSTQSLAIIIDEAQLLTRKDCEKIESLSQTPLQFFCDSNQGPITFKPEHLSEDLSASKSLTLTTNHRSSKRVTTFAKLILEKISKLGVVGDAKLNISASQKSEEGDIDWQISREAVFSPKLTQKIKDNPNTYLIITSDDKKKEVHRLFPNNVVMTHNECQGIEFPEVVLFECISDSKDKTERSRVVASGHKPKQKGDVNNLQKIKNLRSLFSIITRAQESITIINSDNKGVQLLKVALEEEINKSSSEEQTALTKQSSDEDDLDSKTNLQLSAPAKHIIAAARIFSFQNNPEVLRQQVVAALSGIKKESANNKKYIEALTALIKEHCDDLNRSELLCQKIVEALSKNIDNIKLFNILLSPNFAQNFDFSQILNEDDLTISVNGQSILSLLIESQDRTQIKRLLGNKKLEDKKFISENINLLLDSNLSEENFGLLLQFLNPKFENANDLRNQLEQAGNGDRQQEKLAIFFNHFAKDGKLKEHIKKQIKEITKNQGAKPQPFVLDFLKPEVILNIWQEMMKDFSSCDDALCYLIENYHQHILPDDKQETIRAAFSQQSNKGNLVEAQIIKFITSIIKAKSAEILLKPYSDKKQLLKKIISTMHGLTEESVRHSLKLDEIKLLDTKSIAYTNMTYSVTKDNMPHVQGKMTYEDSGDVYVYEGQWEDGKCNGQGKITYKNGNLYEGEVKDGKVNGRGKITYKNGDIYEGEWKDGKYSGKFKITYKASGNFYEGEWKDGKRDGQGRITYKNGDLYEGEVKDGKVNGRGKVTYKNGDIYEGEWKDGKRCGQVKITYKASGDVYEGELKDCNPHGQGKMIFLSGDVYEGEWKDGARDGQGKITYDNGNVYTGEWRDGKQNGQGELHYADDILYHKVLESSQNSKPKEVSSTVVYLNRNFYKGQWLDGRQLGNIVRHYEDGSIYEGEWKDDIQNGQGKMTYKNGDVYEGNYKGGTPSGQGKMIYKDGNVYTGEWKEGALFSGTVKNTDIGFEGECKDGNIGQGRMTYKNGDVYEGEWKKDYKPHGQGKMIFLSGDVYEGEYKDGNCDGQGKMTYKNCNVYEGKLKDGKAHGQGKMTYKNSDVYEGEWKDGKYSGKGKFNYINGDVYEGEWKDGKPDGRGIKIHKDKNGSVSHQIIGSFLEGRPSGKNVRISERGFIALYSGDSPQFSNIQSGIRDVINGMSEVIDAKQAEEIPSRTLKFSKAFQVTAGVMSTMNYLIDRLSGR